MNAPWKWKSVGRPAIVALCSLCMFFTVAGTSAGASTNSGTYVVGATEDLSGALAAYGKWVQSTFTAAFNAANKSGGVNGHKIKLQILDDQSDVTTALTNAKQLLAQHPTMITGSTISDICAALAPVAKKAKTPLNCLNATANQLKPVQQYLYDRNPPEVTTAKPVVGFLKKATGGQTPKVGILVASVGGAIAFGNKVASLTKAKGWAVTDYEKSSSSSTAPPPSQVAKLAASNPNVIVTEITPAETETMLQQLRTDGFTGALISQDSDYVGLKTLADPKYYTLSDNLFVLPSSKGSGVNQYVSQMKSAGITGTKALNTGQLTLDWIQAEDIVAALKNCKGSCSGQQMTTALNSTTISLPGIIKSFGYTASNHIPLSGEYIYGYSKSAGQVKLVKGPVSLGAL